MKIAVTGVGGGIGQSVMKALSIASLAVDVYPVDVTPLSAGLFRGKQGTVLPKPEIPGALDVWERWIKDNGIDALIPGSDHDLIPLATVRDDWEARGVCKVLVSDLSLVQTCRDKAVTCQRLDSEGIRMPRSVWDILLDDALAFANTNGYPVVLKPRDGFASRNVNIIQDEEELRFYFKRTPRPILQEYLNLHGEAQEYTCAVFVNREGMPIGTFMARRDLTGGATYRAEVGYWEDIHNLLLAVGRALKPRGPVNVQLRMTDHGPVPFELNIRCSGTAAIRAYFGYNEPEMLLRHYVLGEPLEPPKPRTGYALRYWNEVFLDGVDQQQLQAGPGDRKGTVLAWP